MGRPRSEQVDAATKRVLRLMERAPRSFTGLVKDGVLSEREAWAVRRRLLTQGEIVVVGSERVGRGQPRVLYGLKKRGASRA